jgi:glutamine synthetase
VSSGISSISHSVSELEKSVSEADGTTGSAFEQASAYRDKVVKKMAELRAASDKLEALVDASFWPIPSYAEMLFSV